MRRLFAHGVSFLLSAGFFFNITTFDPVPLRKGIESARKGTAKHVYVKKHDFTIHSIKVKKTGNKTFITGQISHRLTWRPDDEFYYTIEKENNVVVKQPSYKIKYNEIKRAKDWMKESTVFEALTTYLIGMPIPFDKLEAVENELDNLTKGKDIEWEEAAQYIVSIIAARVK